VAKIGVKELRTTASEVIERVEGGATYVVIRRGLPVAVLLPIAEAEDLVLTNTDQFVRIRREARTTYRKGKTINLRDLD